MYASPAKMPRCNKRHPANQADHEHVLNAIAQAGMAARTTGLARRQPSGCQPADAGVALVGMNYKDETAKGQGFLKKMGNPYQIILQDMEGSLGLDLGVSGAPETYLVSPQGEILARHAGVLDKAVWDQKFAKLWQDNNGHQLFSRQSEATEEQGAE